MVHFHPYTSALNSFHFTTLTPYRQLSLLAQRIHHKQHALDILFRREPSLFDSKTPRGHEGEALLSRTRHLHVPIRSGSGTSRMEPRKRLASKPSESAILSVGLWNSDCDSMLVHSKVGDKSLSYQQLPVDTAIFANA